MPAPPLRNRFLNSRRTPQTILRIMWAEDAAEARKIVVRSTTGCTRFDEKAIAGYPILIGSGRRMFIMHDRNDTTVPFVESRRLARALDELGRPSVYTEFDLFKHVDPRPAARTHQDGWRVKPALLAHLFVPWGCCLVPFSSILGSEIAIPGPPLFWSE